MGSNLRYPMLRAQEGKERVPFSMIAVLLTA